MDVTVEGTDDGRGSSILPSTTPSVGHAHPDEETDHCVICLDGITDHCELMPCTHAAFDLKCIQNWLAVRPTCPLCMTHVVAILHGPPGEPNRPAIEPTVRRESRSRRSRVDEDSILVAIRASTSMMFFDNRPAPRDVQILLRRQLYVDRTFSLPMASNLIRYEELTPERFRVDGVLQARARLFLHREVHVCTPMINPGPRDDRRPEISYPIFLREYIMVKLMTDVLRGDDGGLEMMTDYIGWHRARLLFHELWSFLQSPFAHLEDWDLAVQYPLPEVRQPIPSLPLQGTRRQRVWPEQEQVAQILEQLEYDLDLERLARQNLVHQEGEGGQQEHRQLPWEARRSMLQNTEQLRTGQMQSQFLRQQMPRHPSLHQPRYQHQIAQQMPLEQQQQGMQQTTRQQSGELLQQMQRRLEQTQPNPHRFDELQR